MTEKTVMGFFIVREVCDATNNEQKSVSADSRQG